MAEEKTNKSYYLYRYDASDQSWCFLPITMRNDEQEKSPIETWKLSNGGIATVHNVVYSDEKVKAITGCHVTSNGRMYPHYYNHYLLLFRIYIDGVPICEVKRSLRQRSVGFTIYYNYQQGARNTTIENPMCSWEDLREKMIACCGVAIKQIESHVDSHTSKHTVV